MCPSSPWYNKRYRLIFSKNCTPVYLCQSWEKIEGNDHEVFVRQLKLFGILDVGNVLVEGLLHQGDASLVHWLTVWQKTLLQRGRHARAKSYKNMKRIFHLERHSRRGKRSLSSSLSTFHFCISGGISRLMYSGLFRWCPTLSARVPMASYLNKNILGLWKTRVSCYLQDQQVFMLIFVESEDEGLEDESKVRDELRARLLLQRGKRTASRLLHPLVAVQDPLQQLGHQRLQILLVRLLANPVCISGQGPAGDAPHQSLLVAQAVDKVGDQLTEMGHHSGHASLCNCSQRQDARLLHFPFRMEESLLQDWKEHRQELNQEHIRQNIKCSSWTFPEKHYRDDLFLHLLWPAEAYLRFQSERLFSSSIPSSSSSSSPSPVFVAWWERERWNLNYFVKFKFGRTQSILSTWVSYLLLCQEHFRLPQRPHGEGWCRSPSTSSREQALEPADLGGVAEPPWEEKI